MHTTAYLNGRWLPFTEATIPLTDLGFLQGVIIVERLRTYAGKTFRAESHLQRFRQSCERACIPLSVNDLELRSLLEELLTRNQQLEEELSAVLFATPGSNGVPTLGLYALPLQLERYRPLFERGAWLRTHSGALLEGVDPRIKHRSRLHWWIAEHLHAQPEEELLYTARDGAIRETAVANFLAVIEGEIVSPPWEQILNGVTLQVVREIVQEMGLGFRERELHLTEILTRASECWLTNCTFGCAGVSRLDGLSLQWPGTLLPEVQRRFAERSTGESIAPQPTSR
jgi:branched-chain amino acid aminotransferase